MREGACNKEIYLSVALFHKCQLEGLNFQFSLFSFLLFVLSCVFDTHMHTHTWWGNSDVIQTDVNYAIFEAGFELLILVASPPKDCDYIYVTSHLGFICCKTWFVQIFYSLGFKKHLAHCLYIGIIYNSVKTWKRGFRMRI